MKTYAKLVDGVLVSTCAAAEDTDLIAQINVDGFKPYDDNAEKPDVGELQAAVPAYRESAEGISLSWEIVEHSPEKIEAEIARLQDELSATDYQVVKSYEYALSGEQPPYDIATIHTHRQMLRKQIRDLGNRIYNRDRHNNLIRKKCP